jgi:hypothetical protein
MKSDEAPENNGFGLPGNTLFLPISQLAWQKSFLVRRADFNQHGSIWRTFAAF